MIALWYAGTNTGPADATFSSIRHDRLLRIRTHRVRRQVHLAAVLAELGGLRLDAGLDPCWRAA